MSTREEIAAKYASVDPEVLAGQKNYEFGLIEQEKLEGRFVSAALKILEYNRKWGERFPKPDLSAETELVIKKREAERRASLLQQQILVPSAQPRMLAPSILPEEDVPGTNDPLSVATQTESQTTNEHKATDLLASAQGTPASMPNLDAGLATGPIPMDSLSEAGSDYHDYKHEYGPTPGGLESMGKRRRGDNPLLAQLSQEEANKKKKLSAVAHREFHRHQGHTKSPEEIIANRTQKKEARKEKKANAAYSNMESGKKKPKTRAAVAQGLTSPLEETKGTGVSTKKAISFSGLLDKKAGSGMKTGGPRTQVKSTLKVFKLPETSGSGKKRKIGKGKRDSPEDPEATATEPPKKKRQRKPIIPYQEFGNFKLAVNGLVGNTLQAKYAATGKAIRDWPKQKISKEGSELLQHMLEQKEKGDPTWADVTSRTFKLLLEKVPKDEAERLATFIARSGVAAQYGWTNKQLKPALIQTWDKLEDRLKTLAASHDVGNDAPEVKQEAIQIVEKLKKANRLSKHEAETVLKHFNPLK